MRAIGVAAGHGFDDLLSRRLGRAQREDQEHHADREQHDAENLHWLHDDPLAALLHRADTEDSELLRDLLCGLCVSVVNASAPAGKPCRGAPTCLRVGGVAQAVAQEVEGQHHDDHRQHRHAAARDRARPRLMFWASFSSTPQLVIGGRRPRPRNYSAVSPRIMHGMESVAEAIRWLDEAGQQMAHDDAPRARRPSAAPRRRSPPRAATEAWTGRRGPGPVQVEQTRG